MVSVASTSECINFHLTVIEEKKSLFVEFLYQCKFFSIHLSVLQVTPDRYKNRFSSRSGTIFFKPIYFLNREKIAWFRCVLTLLWVGEVRFEGIKVV